MNSSRAPGSAEFCRARCHAGVAMREDIWEIGVARSGEDFAASEVEKLCQGVETDAHGVKKERVSELIGKVKIQ